MSGRKRRFGPDLKILLAAAILLASISISLLMTGCGDTAGSGSQGQASTVGAASDSAATGTGIADSGVPKNGKPDADGSSKGGGSPATAIAGSGSGGSAEKGSADKSQANVGKQGKTGSAGKNDIRQPAGLQKAMVARVVDGDTIIVDVNGRSERVRLIGIDTPESVHPDPSRNVPYGKVASKFTKDRLDNKAVYLEYDVQRYDQYGRTLAYVYIGGIMFNNLLVEKGRASVSTYPPNVKYVDYFVASQKAARANKLGQWKEPAADTSVGKGTASKNKSTGKTEYIGSTKSMKFHTMDCIWGKKISPQNAIYFSSRDEAINAGYAPCKVCNP